MKRFLLILGALLAIVVAVAVLRRPAVVDPSALVAPIPPAAGVTTVELGDGWFADLSGAGDAACVSLRNDVAQSICVSVNVGGATTVGTFGGEGQRLTIVLAGSEEELTAQWSSRQQSGGPCCRSADPMVEIRPNVWLGHFATSDDDDHWGLQLRRLDGGLHGEHSLLPLDAG